MESFRSSSISPKCTSHLGIGLGETLAVILAVISLVLEGFDWGRLAALLAPIHRKNECRGVLKG